MVHRIGVKLADQLKLLGAEIEVLVHQELINQILGLHFVLLQVLDIMLMPSVLGVGHF